MEEYLFKIEMQEPMIGSDQFIINLLSIQPERAKRSDAEMQSGAPTLAEMQGDTQK
jgi:hypothetical protein